MGRRRRNAYWSTSGGGGAAVQTHDSTNRNQVEISPVLSSPVVEQPVINTRRSLRQQARKAAQTSYAETEDDFVDVEGSDEEEFARFTPLSAPRKRFLKESQSDSKVKVGKRKQQHEASETTATVLNRLINNKRPSKAGYLVKAGRFNLPKLKAGGTNNARHAQHSNAQKRVNTTISAPPALVRAPQHQIRDMPSMLPLKVEIQEGNGTVDPGLLPKKRGRKRKVDLPVNLSMKREPDVEAPAQSQQQNSQDPDWDPNAINAQRKRGRQSAATAHVKNRFPFCSLCLSKDPPDDYIINYMSCPNEYQKMKRLFMYIYKDLRFPFMPFDLERENVFDYCDLPLCNCCIQLYREIFDSYAQIETARDQLKSKIERMVYQIQLSEQNPAVAQQLGSIKNSPDALMNKYCNFRRRFASYTPGDCRGEVEGAALVPATISRIRVINQVPKRTTASQTFLTAGHFPPPPPPTPKQDETSSTSTNVASKTTTSNVKVTTTAESNGTVVIKKEVDSDVPKPSTSSSKTQNANLNGNLVTAFKTSKDLQTPKSTPAQVLQTKTASPKVQVTVPKPSMPSGNPVKPVAHSSVLTIIKTPGGGGPSIIRKLPPKPCIIGQPAKLLAIATPTHKLQGNNKAISVAASKNGPASTEKAPLAVSSKSTPTKPNYGPFKVKDEPVDTAEDVLNPTEEEPDPFFNGNPTTEIPNSDTQDRAEEVKSSKDDSTAADGEESRSQSDTNVFHKHKKLRVLPVPSYKDSSNDSSDNDKGSKEEEKKESALVSSDEMETQPVLETEDSEENDDKGAKKDVTSKDVPPQQEEK